VILVRAGQRVREMQLRICSDLNQEFKIEKRDNQTATLVEKVKKVASRNLYQANMHHHNAKSHTLQYL
jgi:hypothetical protein